MDKSSFIADIRKILSGLKEVDAAYIFGSFLERKDFNDIDVALLLSESLDPYQSLKFSLRIAGQLPHAQAVGLAKALVDQPES